MIQETTFVPGVRRESGIRQILRFRRMAVFGSEMALISAICLQKMAF